MKNGKSLPVAFFGGSFDPPHAGHLGAARGALASGRCRAVVWVPSYAPPHKAGRRRAPFAERVRMIEMLIRGEAAMSVSRIEEEVRLDPSYTVDVLKAWRRRYGEAPALLIGADSLLELHTWFHAADLAAGWEILTYPRRGSEVSAETLAAHWPPETVRKLLAGVLPGEFFEISSTEVRNSMVKSASRCDIIEGNTTPEACDVAAYARERRLYGGETKEMTMTEKARRPEPAELLKCCADCAEEKLARDPTTLVVGESGVADYFLVVTADSDPQLQAVASFIERTVRERYGLRSSSRNVGTGGGWLLLDFGTVVVHVMTPAVRERYSLESLWSNLGRSGEARG